MSYLIQVALLWSTSAWAVMPTNPVSDPSFTRLPNGQSLSSIRVRGSSLTLSRGTGNSFGASAQSAYQQLKAASEADPQHKVQWAFMDLDEHRIIAQSAGANRKIFGASVTKIFTAGALLDHQNGALSSSQLQLMADMLVVSSNTAWTSLQRQIGDGVSDKGRERIHQFTQRMGYERTRGFQGWWGDIHGNELVAAELVEFLHDTYKGEYAGAETFWKLMHTCRTGGARGKKYVPSSVYVGGKTGTYDGDTVDPETGRPTTVRVRNHVVVFNVDGHQYAIAVLADTRSDESAALLVGGLLREYTSLN